MDEAELDRIDMCHAKYYALLEKKRFFSPIGSNPQKILDLGCGTGKGPQCVQMAWPNLSFYRNLVHRRGRRVSVS
jgi:hypothetical protein